jgi:hypothetical protein
MKKQLPFLPLFVFILSLSTAAQDSLSADQIIEKNIEAQGGRPVLESIRTVYTEFKTTMEGHQVHLIIKEMLPNKGSFEIVYQGRTVYKSFFDGQLGYNINNGQKTAAAADDYKDKFYKKNIFDELDYLDTALYTIGLLPEATVGDEPAYVVRTTLKNGAERIVYYSKKTFLELKSERTKLSETERSSATIIDKQNRYQNIMYPSQQRMNVGTDHEQTLTLLNIYFNEKVTDADFQ